MQVILIQNEIEDAIEAYVSNQGINLSGRQLEVDLTAGRGSSGFTATIDISNEDTEVPAVAWENTPEPTSKEKEEPEEAEDVTSDAIIFG